LVGQGRNNLPNIYGPILLCFDPQVICEATDVSISLKSAGALGFDRVTEGIHVDDVPRLFTNPDSRNIRFADSLRKEFNYPDAQDPEMSCCFRDELVPLSNLVYICVDPYAFLDGFLPSIVRQNFEETGNTSRIFKRKCQDEYEMRYQVLLDAILSGVRTASELRRVIPDGSTMSNWRDTILQSSNLSVQFGRYARYLYEGTVN
jgi:hypothetical protein